jgi:PAS domain S-box-containing protein
VENKQIIPLNNDSSLIIVNEDDVYIRILEEKLQQLSQQNAMYKTFDYFEEVMQWLDNQTLSTWSHHVLMKLSVFVEACRGTLYYFDTQKKHLKLAATFAADNIDKVQTVIQLGEGLIGLVAKTQRSMVLDNLQELLVLSSNLAIKPHTILLVPLCYNRRICGVLELSFVKPISKETSEFIDKLAARIAANLYSLVEEEILKSTLLEFKESEDRLQQMAEVTTESILFVQGQRIVEQNLAFLKLTGYNETEVLHQNIDFFFDTHITNLLGSKDLEIELICKNNKKIDVTISSANIVRKANKVTVLRMRDITEQKNAEKQIALQTEQLQEANKIVELLKIIEAKNDDITTSIRYAQRIQLALLPQRSEMKQLFEDYFILYKPRDIVSGDFYWLQNISPDMTMLAVGDCTGHGVPAAFMSMLGIAALNNITLQKKIYSPDKVLAELRKEIYYLLKQDENEGKEGMDIALCLIDYQEAKVQFAGAKNDLIYIQDQQMQVLKGSKAYIGGTISHVSFDLHQFTLSSTTTMYMFSDGYRDQIGGLKKRKIGSPQFRTILQEIEPKQMREQQVFLEHFFAQWMHDGNEAQLDDVAIVGVKIAI